MRLFAGISNPLDSPQVCVCKLCVMGVCCAFLKNVHARGANVLWLSISKCMQSGNRHDWTFLTTFIFTHTHTHTQSTESSIRSSCNFPNQCKGWSAVGDREWGNSTSELFNNDLFLSGLEIDHPVSLSTCSVTAGINVAQNAQCQPEAHSFSSRLCVMSQITLSNTPLKRTE